MVADGFSAEVNSPDTSNPRGKITTLYLLHLCFACGVEVDGDLHPIWEEFALGKGRMEGLATLNQNLMRVLPSCCQVFGGRDNFSAPPPDNVCNLQGVVADGFSA